MLLCLKVAERRDAGTAEHRLWMQRREVFIQRPARNHVYGKI